MSFNKNRKGRDDKSPKRSSNFAKSKTSSTRNTVERRRFDDPKQRSSSVEQPFYQTFKSKKKKEDYNNERRLSKGRYDVDREGKKDFNKLDREDSRNLKEFKHPSEFRSRRPDSENRHSDRSRKSNFERNGDADRKRASFDRKEGFRSRAKTSNVTKNKTDDGMIRLNRFISNAGICSRRKADELIQAGVITVNGQVVTELGTKVDAAKDDVRYNGERLKREKLVYVLLNKPKDFITTTDDPFERKTVMQLVEKASKERIYPVGRLDRNTTGLLLLTNDGKLADKLAHPRNQISKIYMVELDKPLSQGDFNKIEFGVELEDGVIRPDDISYIPGASKREVGIQIHSGKNRIVRRIFEHLGYEVVKLDRTVYGTLTKKDLPRSKWRYLTDWELARLKKASEELK